MIKPMSKNRVINLLLLSFWLSGINSLATTYSIAPAAKERQNGKIIRTLSTNIAPNTPKTGSTIPINFPLKNALNLYNPVHLK